MKLKINPISKLCIQLTLPASKSYSIRALIISACGGSCGVVGASDCDDAKVASKIAQILIKRKKLNQQKNEYPVCFSVGESGTSLRFLLPLLPFFCSSALVEGKGTLVGRPNQHLCEALRQQGLTIRGQGSQESIPIKYCGGSFKGGTIHIDGSLSSQFISALMIASPLAKQSTQLVLQGEKLVSQEYITMTKQILSLAGIRVIQKSKRKFLIPGQQKYRGLKNFKVPSDWGLAAFWMVAGAILPSKLILKGHMNHRLIQSDGMIVPFLKKMGVKMNITSSGVKIKGPFLLKGGVFSLKDCPDLVPIMTVAAMFAEKKTCLKDIAHARVKESDRISDLRKELLKVGAKIEEKADQLIIYPQKTYKKDVVLDPHHDHRLAMAFAVLGLKIGTIVLDMECSSKSYPLFVQDLKKVKESVC